jgi:hypothetical protein
MTNEKAVVDALYEIASEIKQARQEIGHYLRNVGSTLVLIDEGLSQINKSLPNPLDVPE